MNMTKTVRTSLMIVTGLAMLATADKAVDSSVKNTFYVYADKGAKVNHFIPSGWMGDYGDIKVDDASTADPADGKTCIKITYTGKATQGANWAGVFWQNPANNWGDKPGGYDLSAFKRITFWARGTEGNEKIAEFKVGGITGEHGDSDSGSIGPVTLSKEWKKVHDRPRGQKLIAHCGWFLLVGKP